MVYLAPLPLYSTLMMLAGYTYGPTTAFFISYFASLLGALVVFLIFRHLVPSKIASSLLPPSLKRVVRAIEQRPSIFLLIRVAPYPYNVLNAVLGSSSTMTLSRYIGTTAISLLKVIVHTTLGSEIRSFKDLHAAKTKAQQGEEEASAGEISWGEIWTAIGIVLCVGLFIYLFFVARRAVNEECVDDGSSDATGEGECDDEEIGGMSQRPGPNGYTALPMASGASVTALPLSPPSPPAVAAATTLASSNPFERASVVPVVVTEEEEGLEDAEVHATSPHRSPTSVVLPI